jgi:uncharacterized protein (TIRG00374 family)
VFQFFDEPRPASMARIMVNWGAALRSTSEFSRKALGFVAKAIVSALVVSFIIARVDLAGVGLRLAAASPPRLALALAAFLLIPLLGGLRWWLALRGIGARARLSEITVLFSTAAMVGQVLPSIVGDGVRVWLAARNGHGVGASVQSVLLERVFMVVTLLALSLLTAPLLAARTGYSGPIWLSAALFLVGIGAFAVLLAADQAPGFLARRKAWRRLADGAAAARRLTLSRWGAYLACTSVLGNLNFALAAFLLGSALDVQASAWDMIAIMPAVTLATTLPISLGGWGVREGALVLLLGRLGVPATQALSLSLLFGAFGIVSGLPGLLVWVFDWRRAAHRTALRTGLSYPRGGQ